MDIKSYST